MDARWLHALGVLGLLGAAAVTFVVLLAISAPYGRHRRSGWGPELPRRLGWIVMESPAIVVFVVVYALGEHRWQLVPLIGLGLWQTHYVYRTLIYPFRMHMAGKRDPVLITALAFTFQTVNAALNAQWLSHLGDYPLSWIADPRFVLGVSLFVLGWGINHWADATLRRLRRPGETGYRIPRGGLYRWISCPNYLGEILEWLGWALAMWSWAGLAFGLYTAANLVPRALSHHRWYRQHFDDYPAERKALVPFVL